MSAPDWYRPPAADVPPPEAEAWTPRPEQTVGFWLRGAARGIDAVVGIVLAYAAQSAYLALPARVASALPRLPSFSLAGELLIGMAIALGTNTAAEGIGGATLGKLVAGIRVRRKDGARCTPGAAFKRSLAYFWDALFFGIVAYQAMSKNVFHQRVGDRWADTVVVQASAIPIGARFRQLAIVGALVDVALVFVWNFLSGGQNSLDL